MTGTPTLDITHVPAAATNKYLYVNDGFDRLDNAMNASLSVDCSAGGTINVTATQLRDYGFLNLTGTPAANFNLQLGAVNRNIPIYNGSGKTAAVGAGTRAVTVNMANAEYSQVRIDTNNVYRLGAAGAAVFISLTDVPSSYSGQSLKGVRVNAGETALEFYTIAATLTQENVEDYAAAMFTGGTHTGISFSYNDATGLIDATVSGGMTQEQVEDYAAGIFTSGVHDGISVSYNDAAGRVDLTAKPTECLVIACGDETSAITSGTGKVTFRMPYAFTVTSVRASLTTAQTSGTILTIDINESGTTILSTKLTVDNSEKTSTTAATAAVISDSSLADDAEITIDFDSVGTGGAGVKVYLIGHRT